MDEALLQRLVFKINRKRVSNETVQSTVKDHKLHYLKYLSNIFLDFWTFWLFGKQGSIDKGHISWKLKRRASFVFVKKINKWGSFDLEKVIQKMTGRSSPSGVGTGLHDQDRGDGPTTTWFWEFITIMTSKMVLDASSLWKSPPSNKMSKIMSMLEVGQQASITIKTSHKLVSFLIPKKVIYRWSTKMTQYFCFIFY